ncbi:MAG: DUF2239 family protein [Burkholderiaceae bacterium]
MESSAQYIAFEDDRRLAAGGMPHVARKVRQTFALRPEAQILVFDHASSELIDVDLRAATASDMPRPGARAHAEDAGPAPVVASNPPARPGRPRLGVVAREVTLLPRHWDWLNVQPGGASVALRKLVEQAKRANLSKDRVRQAQEASYRFMSAMAGDRVGFEEAARALFAGDGERFRKLLEPWPQDIRAHLNHLSGPAFDGVAEKDVQHA